MKAPVRPRRALTVGELGGARPASRNRSSVAAISRPSPEWLTLPDEELARRVVAFLVARLVARPSFHGKTFDSESIEVIAQTTMGHMAAADFDEPRVLGFEKALHKFAAGDIAGGARVLRESLIHEAQQQALETRDGARRAKLAKNRKAANDARRTYTDEEKTEWRRLAREEFAHILTVSDRARAIVKRKNLGDIALRTVRREIIKKKT